MLLVMKTLEDEWYIVIKAVLRHYHILCVLAIPTYTVYQLYDNKMILAIIIWNSNLSYLQ